MKIINNMKKNWEEHKLMEREEKRLKAIENAKKDLKLTNDDVQEIIKLIGEQNPAWAQMDPDLMTLFLQLAIKQFKPKEEDFNVSNTKEMRQKIADIFNGSNDKVKFTIAGQTYKPNTITPDEIKKVNDAYSKGKGMGSGFKKGLKALFKKQTKNI